MKRLSCFFKKAPFLYFAMIVAYFLLVVLPHELIGKWLATSLDEKLGREKYNQLVLFLAFVALATFATKFWVNVKSDARANKGTIAFLLFTLAIIAVAFNYLVVVNIEVIHLFQYALLAILLFPAVGSYGATIGWATLLGAADEAWQHFYLAPLKSNYYDFNDILLDLLGAALGLIIIKSSFKNLEIQTERAGTAMSALLLTTGVLALLLPVAFAAGLIHYYTPEKEAICRWVIIRAPQTSFWTTVHPNVTFHVMQPMEGLIVLSMLLLYYQGLDNQVNIAQKSQGV
ncbi:MAG: hypothetical protein RI973_1320 [Bacteroidota bacterium]|jgi:hypothetical protein